MVLISSCLVGQAGTDADAGKADSLKLLASAAARVEHPADVRSLSFESSPPQPSGLLSWSALTGDWGGARSSLNEAGVSLKVLYRTDQMSNLNGGSELRSGSINHLDLMLSVDAGTAFGIDGMLLSAHVIANNGGSISKWVGDAQMVSNLEASKLTKLYQLWISQSFAGDHLSVLLGLYDLNSEFYATPGAGLFLNGSHGVGKELSQTGQNGPSIFPNTALAMRVLGTLNGAYVQAAVLDGCPGTRENPLSASFAWNAGGRSVWSGVGSRTTQ
jgi:carbohydrate-selective porin OprB